MSNAIEKLSVNNLAETIFVIPYYQRGYRWSCTEAKHLFDDLLEFADSSEKEYCLQSVALQKITEIPAEYKNFPPVENQTVLRVVDGQQRLTTMAILLRELGIVPQWDIYYLAEDKTLSKLLNTDATETINNYFRNEVRKAFQKYSCEDKGKLERLLDNSDKSITFLRYDIDKHEDDHEAFLRLNAGKTPLSSSELIRALYMVNASGLSVQERMEISKEWELIENTLHQEQFWLMFNAKGLNDTPTRMDLLFALVMSVNLENAKANPRIVFEKMDDSSLNLRAIWQDVLRCFWWMQSCYDDVELFNYLGWINEFTDISACTIYDNFRKYPSPADFRKSVIAILQKKFANKTLMNFTYECDKVDLRALFVLLNVLECNKCKERFRFDLYKNESWDIEHIDSQTPNDLADAESQRAWLLSVWHEYKGRNLLDGIIGFDTFDEKNIVLDHFVEQFEAIREKFPKDDFDGNAIGNLVLLNTSINRSYKNAIFPSKRKTIKGLIASGECYIPPCTKNAFMKFYTTSPSRITEWLKEDFDGYGETMKQYFEKFQGIDTQLPDKNKPTDKIYATMTKRESPDSKNVGDSKDTSISRPRISDAIKFTDFMAQYHVVIPKIQRAYVQGRQDSYGKKCLLNFANSLVESVSNASPLSLDFVYGIDAGNEFQPLDGQQRLTTLLLLAWLCGQSNKEWIFKYDSRRAAECFIQGLLEHNPPAFDNSAANACSNYIKASNWFLAAWEHDSGIAGMLAMLDSLYEKLYQRGKSDFTLNGITFFVNYLDTAVKSYDQIFLKMNSRGKELTAWENIKAVLDQCIPYALDDVLKWKENLNNVWQESLWKKLPDASDKINTLDSTMLSVVELALDCAGYRQSVKDNTFQLAQWLESSENENSKRDFYQLCSVFFSALEERKYTNAMKQALTPSWSTEPCIPNFAESSTVIFYKALLAFYAATQSQNAEWMRIVWNIVENCGVSRSNFSSAYKLIEELSNNRDDILAFLADDTQEIKSKFATEQVREERKKAKLLTVGDSRWMLLKTAEAYTFLKGRLSVILEASNEDYCNFEKILAICNDNVREEKMLEFFKESYLPWARDEDLPLSFNFAFFKMENWKSMFFFNPSKSGVISWLRALNNNEVANWDKAKDWAKNLHDHWDEICSVDKGINEYTKIFKYQYGWENNKVFLYRNATITGAQLLSNSLRQKLNEVLNMKANVNVWRHYGYDFEIQLENGICITHHPDDIVSVEKDDKFLYNIQANELIGLLEKNSEEICLYFEVYS